EKLPTTDKAWMTHLGGCILCDEDTTETHTHMFFRCHIAEDALQLYANIFDSLGPIASGKETWNGRRGSGGDKHIVNIAYRALLSAMQYTTSGERGT
ncbi:UNVERIFIED_CONTAM: hypothetical protein Sindi_1842500, partial [Sesamum indicum]